MKMQVLQTMHLESVYGWLQISQKLEKWQWNCISPTWRHHQFFWNCFVSCVKFSCWLKFHVNIITSSIVMTIKKELTRNPEIGNNPIWVLPNIWRLGQVRDTKQRIVGLRIWSRLLKKSLMESLIFCVNLVWMSWMKYYWILQIARITAFTVCQLLRENKQGVGWGVNWTILGPDLCFIRFYAEITPYKIAIFVICSYTM